jgi:hypothetical protein
MRSLALVALLAGCGDAALAPRVDLGIGGDAAEQGDLAGADLAQLEQPDLVGADLAGADLTSSPPADLATAPDLAQPADFAACGAPGAYCCAAFTCTQANTTCRRFDSTTAGAPPQAGQINVCTNCGHVGEACCTVGQQCASGNGVCDVSGKCV